MSTADAHHDLQLTAHVTVLIGEQHGKYPDGNSVIVRGSDAVVLIDPSLTVHRRRGLGEQVDRVLVSHAHEDHIAGLSAVSAQHIHVHDEDLPGVQSLDGLLQVYGLTGGGAVEQQWREQLVASFHVAGWPQATGFADGASWDLGGVRVTAMHLPGHTRGHTAYLVEPGGVAFVGDIDLTGFGPYYGDHWSDLDQFVTSIERAATIDAAHYVTFHHKGVVTGRDRFVTQLADFAGMIERRDEALVAMLDRGVDTVESLVAEGIVYRPGARPDLFGESVERRTITLHLERLRRWGQLDIDPHGRISRR